MKLKQLQKSMNVDEIIILSNDYNNVYLTGFNTINSYGILSIKKTSSKLLVPKMEITRAKKITNVNVEQIKKNSLQRKNKTIGINKSNITINQLKQLKKNMKNCKFVDVSKTLEELRKTKTEKEIQITKKACKLTDKIFQNFLNNVKKFKTENDIAIFLEQQTRINGAKKAFHTIVASGKNAELPHHESSTQKIKKGFCIIDFGINLKNYNSDFTRTIYFGKPSKKEKEIYNKVLQTKKEAEDMLKIGTSYSKIHNFAEKKLGKHFPHALGHGIGIEVHENPQINPSSKDKVKKNNLITIEPGIYTNKYGIRIEDTILIKNKPKKLTKTNLELIKL